MTKGDTSLGLLSKVAKFVRNPTKDWSELDQPQADQDSTYNREVLKEMIERKRQNDFVRKREFDYLRKLRRRETRHGSPNAVGRPSFFQSSLPSNPDERAETLKKIDEIEAQMSRQWWKGKQDEADTRAGAPPMSKEMPLESTDGASAQRTHPPQSEIAYASTMASDLRPDSQSDDAGGFSSSQMGQAETVPGMTDLEAQTAAQAKSPAPAGSPSAGQIVGAGFASQKLFAVELADTLTDPDMEEASIRFANGDDAGAEATLLHALASDQPRPELAEAWMSALFDLYRATGQQAKFDQVALDFASRFGRSAPAWFSTPELLGQPPAELTSPKTRQRPPGREPIWNAPAELSLASLAELQAMLQRGTGPWCLDWSALTAIPAEVRDELGLLFGRWCILPLKLIFRGAQQLDRVLKTVTPSGDRRSNPLHWQLRMDALRIMRLQDEFELVALEYCVTFEVSPPSWQDARCSCEMPDLAEQTSEAASAEGWDEAPGQGATVPMGLGGNGPTTSRVELSGEILGDAADVLKALEAGFEGADRLVISCANLIRVDFTAAGSILNWVASHQSDGCQMQFREVNRIVAAFFNVIGITEHARVVPRNS